MWSRIVGTAVIAGALALSGGQGARAASDRPVQGTIVSRQVTTGCLSPVALCTTGEFRGALSGTFDFTATSLVPSSDTPETGVVFYTGNIQLHTRDGDVAIRDAGAFNTGTGGDVASVSAIVSGTGAMSGASGFIRIAGVFQAGCVGCEYSGTLRLP